MKKHSKVFKAISFILCFVFFIVGSRTDVFAAAVNVTTTYTCPRTLCSKKLIIDGPYGNATDVLNSSIPYLGGKTFSEVYTRTYSPTYMYRYHLYVIYCPKYSYSDSSLTRHTLTLMFARHGYTVTGYSQNNSVQHYKNMVCDHGTDFTKESQYQLSQELCGEKAMLSNEEMEGLVNDYQVSNGCGITYSETEDHTFTYGEWKSSGSSYHIRSKTCSLCGYTAKETKSHSFIISDNYPYDGINHYYTKTCTICGYSEIIYEKHEFTYGDWSPVDSFTHMRNKTCSKCLYSDNETADHRDDNGDNICDDCGYDMLCFSVTVPTSMNLIMSENGMVYAADDVSIQNNSNASVKVSSIKITGKNGWTVVPYSTNMANEKVNCKKVGFILNNIPTTSSGQLALDNNWTIAANSSLPLNYNAVISATSSPIVNQNILDVKYIIEWSD